ncbi:ATP-binding cassette, subfamily B, bacterial [Ketogulonicigenium robustum]|uniref:ATP-binding cassette, subfamily B, bacterial n=1 Tax=Ketogulonicigenium robustum TaxID=92947 RepID=A0A1W6P1D1_9RHOB|nr:ABC transporter ATP-binding protein [Ketogulonicigenium robustum]ARO15315.1 ATP-binding cassette, subfamily B, bacterial [Ketogulonicigenium robustum]
MQLVQKIISRFVKDDADGNVVLRLLRYGLATQGKYYAIGILAMVVVATSAGLTAWSMELIINAMSNPSNREQLTMVSMIVVGIFALRGIGAYIQAVAMAKAGNGIIAHQQRNIFNKLMEQGVDFFNLRESSDTLMRVTQSAQSARGLIDIIATSAVRDMLTLVSLLAVMVYQQPVLTLAALTVGPLAFLMLRTLVHRVREVTSRQMMSLAEILRVLQETSAGIRIVKIFALEDLMRNRMSGAVRAVEKRSNAITRLESVTMPVMDILAGLTIASILWLSTWNVVGGANGASAGQLMSFITAMLMCYDPARRLSQMRVRAEAMLVGVRMLFELIDMKTTLNENADGPALQPGPSHIRLEDVTFAYGERKVLENVEMDIPAGKMTAIVGLSGAGKSTVMNLIMRLYDPTEGRVTIDGQDISRVQSTSLRHAMAYVGQDTFLFSTSIMENIRYARPDASDDDVKAAASAAFAHDFISALPQGYQTPVGENGAFLSGGQRQRISIARAFLKDASILLLDEATSALDAISEEKIREAVQVLGRGRTRVAITHRLSTIMAADVVYVMEDGHVIETGSVDALLQANGPFRDLYDKQFG